MGYSENATNDVKNTTGAGGFKHGGTGNLATALTVAGVRVRAATFLRGSASNRRAPKDRNMISHQALLSTGGVEALAGHYRHLSNEVPMATHRHDQIVETPTEARQAELGPSVLALLTASTGLAVLILGVVWFVFFRA
jgi:hypothetical protein